jgi:hypothetical protein
MEVSMKKKSILNILFATLFLLACKESGLNISIRFDQVMGLKANDMVIFESNPIGLVTRVHYAQNGFYWVNLKIKDDFAQAATENARFYVIEDPQTAGQKAIEMIQIRKGGALLADGATVEGSTRSLAVFQKMLKDFDQQTGKLGAQIEQFVQDLRNLSQSAEVKQLQKDLEQLGGKMEEAGKAARHKIQNEIVPLLKKELDHLKKRLEQFGREKEVEPLEKQLEKLTIT